MHENIPSRANRGDENAANNNIISRRAFLATTLVTATTVLLAGPEEALAAKKKKKKVVKYDIVYKLNGGTNPKNQILTIAQGKTILASKLKVPTRVGYTFKNWYADSAFTTKMKKVTGLKAVRHRRVYAKWSKIHYSITYELNKGSFKKDPKASYTIETADYTLKTPLRTGYDFEGWYTAEDFSGEAQTVLVHGNTGDKVYYAKWAPYTSWDRYLEERLPVVKERCEACAAAGGSFIFITDVHWASNTKKSPELMQAVMEQAGIDKVFCAGDLINSHSTETGHADALASMTACMDAMLAIPKFYVMRGNHDSNDESANRPLTENWLSDKEYFETVFREGTVSRAALCETGMMEDYGTPVEDDAEDSSVSVLSEDVEGSVGSDDGDAAGEGAGEEATAERIDGDDLASKYVPGSYPLCYYVDDEDAKIRYICVDSGHPSSHRLEPEQVAWLTESILSLDEGWGAFVMSHILFKATKVNGKIKRHSTINYIEDALDGIYDICARYDITIIGVLSGHTHRDYHVVSDKGYPLITRSCDAWGKSEDWSIGTPMNHPGTIEEQCFDVVHIDKSTRTITLTRIGGYGEDCSFTY